MLIRLLLHMTNINNKKHLEGIAELFNIFLIYYILQDEQSVQKVHLL